MIAETPGKNSFSSFWSGMRIQFTRYLNLLRRRWWLLILTISVGLCAAAWYLFQQPPAYLSAGRLMVSGQIRINEGAQYTEELMNFFGTQVELMQSGEVRQRAHKRVQALHPELARDEVKLEVGQVPRASIFIMRALGRSSQYTQAYLDACMDEYISVKKQMRSQKSESTAGAIADELVQLEKEMQKDELETHEFQKENNIGFLREEGNSAGTYLAGVNRRLADLRTEYDLLARLDLDQNLERQPVSSPTVVNAGGPQQDAGMASFGPLAEYQKAKQKLEELLTERADLGKNLRPKHPSMVALAEQISKSEALIESYRRQSMDAIKTRREAIRLQIESLEEIAKQWGVKAIDLSRRIADFEKIKSKQERTKAQYDRLLTSMHSVDVTKRVDQDMISILEKASMPISTRPGLEIIMAAGFASGVLLGLAILFVLDKLDDRIGSFLEVRANFVENLLGQIPKELGKGGLGLLLPNDNRHSLLESFRTLRSSLIFLPVESVRPKTLLVTSATPGEGKTTISSNLAISLAFSGAKTLLIDADLRRGRLHDLFHIPEENQAGLSKVLQQKISWQQAIVSTTTPNLSVLPRGKSLAHPGEHFLGKVTDQFLQEIYKHFEYIIFDSAPVMAADDALSLAPKIDGTIFVVRFGVSSVRSSRKSIELLAQRRVNLLGLVCNDVKLSESEYGYGYYYDYKSHEQELGASA
jgi:capsular exopolysaccharide synthesis family protein